MATSPDPVPTSPSSINRYLVEHYDDLRKMAAGQMAREHPDNSLQATALVNEAACQMLDPDKPLHINNGQHFLATARVMMQHILIDKARHKQAIKAGGLLNRQPLADHQAPDHDEYVNLLFLNEALQQLAQSDLLAAQVIQKRCEGCSMEEVAMQLNISRSHAYSLWELARTWLQQMFNKDQLES